VLRNIRGSGAQAVEELQNRFEGSPGFLGVVHDGVRPVVIVEATVFGAWEQRLAPTEIAVTPSCVDGTLLAAVLAVLPDLHRPGTGVLAGYDVLDDSIFVRGVEIGALITALKAVLPGAEQTAFGAIADGTLRIDTDPPVTIDVKPPVVTTPPRSP
jgi:hypothetical protein